MGLEELLPYVATVAAFGAALLILYATSFRKKKEKKDLRISSTTEATAKWQHRAEKSISFENAKEAKEELRTLSLEREILSDAIRHLYEAHAEGKITEEEREQLAKRYKSRMMTVKDAIADNESVVALHELEAMQDDLIKLFDERFDELNTKIETLRSRVGIKTEEAFATLPVPLPQIEEEETTQKVPVKRTTKKTRHKKMQKSRKTEAEERIEKIRTEVEKVLDRLEQMEAET